MLVFLIRFVILLFAGYALFRLLRASQSSERWVNIVIAIGFLGRAIAGQILFWISYAQLPIARGLQMGDGLWFFAVDAMQYVATARRLAQMGVRTIIDYPAGGASVAFVKVLSAAVFLLGPVTSVGMLLNLFCYLGTIAVIVRWSEGERRARTAAAVAICAISLSPAFFLWSLQPLKDTFFQFVVIAFIGACAAWQQTWRSPRVRVPLALLIAASMTVALLAISGVRWYFAFALFIAVTVFLLLVASLSPVNKAVAFTASAVLALLLSRVFLFGGGPYVPLPVRRVLRSPAAIGEVRQVPKQLLVQIQASRDGFDRAGGRTSIRPGGNTSKLDQAFSTPAAVKGLPAVKTSSAVEPPLVVKTSSPAQPPVVKTTSTVEPPPVVKTTSAVEPPPVVKTSSAVKAPPAVKTSSAVEPPQVHKETKKPVAESHPPLAPPVSTLPSTQASAPNPGAAKTAATSVKPAPPPRQEIEPQADSVPARLLTGVASVVMPRSIGERMGVFRIGGGQKMFWFTDLDTIVFDFIALFAVLAMAAGRFLSLRNPLVWFLALLTVLAGLPLAYAITNYGTLYRLREMIYIGLALTPLAVATAWRRDEAAVTPDESPASS